MSSIVGCNCLDATPSLMLAVVLEQGASKSQFSTWDGPKNRDMDDASRLGFARGTFKKISVSLNVGDCRHVSESEFVVSL